MSAKKIFPLLVFLGYGFAFFILLWKKKIMLFLHPDFIPLAYLAMIGLFLIGLVLVFSRNAHHHMVLSPLKVVFLLIPLLCVFAFDLKPLSSNAALERGVNTGALTIGRRVSTNQFATKPENRSLYQWVIALNADPEPSHYEGQAVHIKGFVIHDPHLPADQISIARFIVTCCAADARVLSLPVQISLPSMNTLANDQWIELEGKMQVIVSADQRSLVVMPSKVTSISIPDDPYEL